MSFKRRLILFSAVAVSVAIVLGSVAVFFIVRGQLRRQVDRALIELHEDVTASLPPGSLDLSSMPPGTIALPLAPVGGARGYAQFVNFQGVTQSLRGGDGLIPSSQRALAVAAGEEDAYFTDRSVNGVHARVFTAPLVPGLALQTARPLSEVDSVMKEIGLVLVLVAASGVALAAGLGWVVARSALMPVARMTATAERVTTTGDLTQRIEVGGTDELARLASSFNSMLEALETSLGNQRQLVMDASHELRTPLTSVRTNMEVLQRGGLPEDEQIKIVADVIAQLEELSVLINDLVELARGQEQQLPYEDVRLDLLVADAVERQRRYSPHVEFDLDSDETTVRGVASRLERAVTNLLDNAAKWSPPQARVEVVVRDGQVSVRDHGPGVSADDLPHLFERFYRAPAARSLPGSGLGLAIVRQIVESHGGRVFAESPEGGGALFCVALPDSS